MAKRRSFAKRLHRRLDKAVDAPWLLDLVAGLVARRIRHWQHAIDWEIRGQDALAAQIATGQPVIMAVWHGRLAMTPSMWRAEWGPVCSLTSKARPGQIVGRTLGRFGWTNASMHDTRDNRSVSLSVARLIRQGTSIGIACDGPLGPARQMKTVPLDWSRLSGAPIWLWTYSVAEAGHLNTWDRLLLPKGRRGVMLYQQWSQTVPKRASQDQFETLRRQLEHDLNALTREADQAMGHADLLC